MQETTNEDRYFTTGEVARAFNVDPTTVLRWCETMGLPHEVTPTGRHIFRESELREWYRKQVGM